MEHDNKIGGLPIGETIPHGGVDNDALHCLEASILAQRTFDRVVAQSVEAISENNELEELSVGQLRMLERSYETNAKWVLAHKVGNEILRRTME